MAISKDELFDVLREHASDEFKDIPKSDAEIDYKFSKKFDRKMKKMFNSIEKKPQVKNIYTLKRGLAVAAAIVVLFVCVLGANADTANHKVELYTEVHEKDIDFHFSKNTLKEIQKEYPFTKVPSGFTKKRIRHEVNFINEEFENENGDSIRASQYITYGLASGIDNERGIITTRNINGTEVLLYESINENVCIACWCYDVYFFKILYSGCSDIEDLVDLIKANYDFF
ncbi:MAG: DUF4367 domain-containing protein [Ruminococcus sp.]|nr:DUF4367 domain-containing protein [Ruminococcus sp.]